MELQLVKLLLLLPTLLQVTAAAAVADNVSVRSQLKSDVQSFDSNQVCYEGLGCFRNDGNFYHYLYRAVSLLPQSPRVIDTKFAVFTRRNRATPRWIQFNRADLVTKSNFDPAKETKILIHGFLADLESSWMMPMKDALLDRGDYNIIGVDWSGGNGLPYTQATANTQVVGAEAARLIRWLESTFRADRRRFHLIGHSLGAHISGYIGRRLEGKIPRITALDPAGPYFEFTHPEVRLDRTDAQFVDAIHTDGSKIINIVLLKGGFGMMQAIGHVDFYPNGGKVQPACSSKLSAGDFSQDVDVRGGSGGSVTCNHSFAHKLMLATVLNSGRSYKAVPCDSYENYKAGKCSCGSIGCASMGINANRWKPNGRHGVKMFLDTTASSPYEIQQ